MTPCLVSTKAIPGKTKIILFDSKSTHWFLGLSPHMLKKKERLESSYSIVEFFNKNNFFFKTEFIDGIIKEKRFSSMINRSYESVNDKKHYSKRQILIATGIFEDYPMSIVSIGTNPIHTVRQEKDKYVFAEIKKFQWHHMKLGDGIVFPWREKASEEDREKEIYYLHDYAFLKKVSSNKVFTRLTEFPSDEGTMVIEEPPEIFGTDSISVSEENETFVLPPTIEQEFSSEKRSYSLPCLMETFGMSGYKGVVTVYDDRKNSIGFFSINECKILDAEIRKPKKNGMDAMEHLVLFPKGIAILDTRATPIKKMNVQLPGGLYEIMMSAERKREGIIKDENEFRAAAIK